MYEVVFGMGARELFAGMFDQVERRTLKRVQLLTQRLGRIEADRMTDRKLALLRAVASGAGTESANR